MQYFGGKVKIAKDLSLFLNQYIKENNFKNFVDMFCGSCNISSKINIEGTRYANDKHSYLIAMWESLQKGWIPPTVLTKEEYNFIKDNKDLNKALTGFVGFGCSFSGKWFGGFAKSGGRNYCLNAHNSIIKKLNNLKDVKFSNKDYKDFVLPEKSLIYCDIPYKDTTPYCKKEVGVFDHKEFYSWCETQKEKGHTILISEYAGNVPTKGKILWSKCSKKDIRDIKGIQQKTTEVLFTL